MVGSGCGHLVWVNLLYLSVDRYHHRAILLPFEDNHPAVGFFQASGNFGGLF